MKEFKIDKNTFIGGWYIDKKICDEFIKYFNENKVMHEKGTLSENNLNTDIKESLDIYFYKKDFSNKIVYKYLTSLQDVLNNYLKKYPFANNIHRFELSRFNMQYYKPKQGFKKFHCERQGLSVSTRCLVFMTYLNDVPDGGTVFKHQKITTPAKKGLTLIWPTDWTHTHKGEISKKYEKYILTGWYEFIE